MKKSQRSFLFLSRNGSMLITVMGALLFFAILNVAIYRIGSGYISLSARLNERITSRYLARAAVEYEKEQRQKKDISFDSLYDLSLPRKKELKSGEFVYTLSDEESRININTAPATVIERLPGLDPELAKGINESPLRPFSAEEESLLVDGMDEEIFDKFRGFITVHSNSRININTAPKEVLIALGLDESLAGTIVYFRSGPDGVEATEDDNVFEGTAEIISRLESFTGLPQEQKAALNNLIRQNAVSVASENIRLKIETDIFGRQGLVYEVIVDGKDAVKSWREY
jgi:DNA uptake protein ComE-like DNA-binding protein